MIDSYKNIVCIWYPSGGFGHFINSILTLYVHGYAKTDQQLIFSESGNSHNFSLVLPKYFKNPKEYVLPDSLNPLLKYPVLVDNGITDESTTYRNFFPGATTIKLCYTDWSWPIVARTMIQKAMVKDFYQEIKLDSGSWPTDEAWCYREKYFLYLRDNNLRHLWKPDNDCQTIWIEDLLDYDTMLSRLSEFGECADFASDWQRWRRVNSQYLDPVTVAKNILFYVKENKKIQLEVTDIWTQAVVNYYIWVSYGIEVPANSYSNWFTNIDEIINMLSIHGVKI